MRPGRLYRLFDGGSHCVRVRSGSYFAPGRIGNRTCSRGRMPPCTILSALGAVGAPPGRVPERVSPLAAPHSPSYRLALVKPEWSVGQNVVDPASIRRSPFAGDMGLSTERQCNLRRTRIKPIPTMSL